MTTCPFCGSSLVFKAGFRTTRTGERVQRFLCRVCLRRFSLNSQIKSDIALKNAEMSDPAENLAECFRVNSFTSKPAFEDSPLPFSKDVAPHNTPMTGEHLYTFASHDNSSREGEELPAGEVEMSSSEGAVTSSILLQKPGTGQDKELEGKLIGFAWWLKKQGKADATIKNYVAMLRLLVKNNANLEDPESVKDVLAKANKSDGWKVLAVKAYSSFLSLMGKTWIPPKVKATRPLPFIPMEKELDDLIAGCGPRTSTLLQLLKETGMRIGEALRLAWKDIDLERRVIILNEPEKNSNPRIFRISPKLVGMLNTLPKTNERIFPTAYNVIKANFEAQRKRLARKLNNPRLQNITFHTFRHWKATMEYHKTKDILHVKELLGHKDIENTMLYIQVEKALFNEDSSEFTVKVAKTPEEIQSLLEAGFEYVCEKDDLMFFRKRK